MKAIERKLSNIQKQMKKLMEAKKNLKVKLSKSKKLISKKKPAKKTLLKSTASLKEAMLKLMMKEAGMILNKVSTNSSSSTNEKSYEV